MSQDILQGLIRNPQDIFKLRNASQSESTTTNIFNELTKSILNPIVKNYSVLDELYTDGLDSSQVFGQTKMVLDGIGSKLLGQEIPQVREQIGEDEDEDENENEDQDQDQKVDDDEDEGIRDEEQVEFGSEDDASEEKEGLEDLDRDTEDEKDQNELSDDGETLVGEDDDEEKKDGSEVEVEHRKDVFGLNDGFFDIDEYNKQVLALENQQDGGINDDDDEEIDYFGSLSDEDEEQMDYYDDFYDKPGKVRNTKSTSKDDDFYNSDGEEDEVGEGEFADEDYDNAVNSARLDLFADSDEKSHVGKKAGTDNENLSSFEKKQLELQREIEKLEAELVADKKWTLKGEITSNERPKESLLEENELSFDRTAKPVPTITQEVTETIEDLIRKRIKNDEFDDLPRRIVQDLSNFHQGPKADVSQQKSSKSLAELYEDEYNQVDAQQEELDEAVKKQHEEIGELFTKVTHKLDALCSAHFIPKPHEVKSIEIKVTDASAPASISMEDAQPLNVSSESRLAPQEIYKIGDDANKGQGVKGKSEVQLKSGLSYSKDELNREEKQRLRRANKRKKSKQFNDRQEVKRQKLKQQPAGADAKRPKNINGKDVVDTLSKAKNVSVIGAKGELRDVKGNLKKSNAPQTGSRLRL
ncbi:MPP10 [Candida theae]|uniref:U3 small nucleolar ribonucleoprotein protein MPP10 n=1 Tax=Candida theae TaxID=1198502 RepID=A0AAD5BE71_9ASCO|nr:MPP10 [Candida theae]KAI5957451.1 MPP10 [Candida theae]